jgi:hypothetical protein
MSHGWQEEGRGGSSCCILGRRKGKAQVFGEWFEGAPWAPVTGRMVAGAGVLHQKARVHPSSLLTHTHTHTHTLESNIELICILRHRSVVFSVWFGLVF